MFILNINEKLTLRMLSARDAAPLFQIIDDSRDYLRVWLPWLDETKSVEDSLDFIKQSFVIYNNRSGITAGIFLEEELVGVVSFNTIDWKTKAASIGYWLAESAQGKGLMTRAVRALINYGFRDFELNRIEIRVAEGNTASRAIPERLGFKQEGVIRHAEWLYDHFVDHVVYGLLASEWEIEE